MAKLLESLYEQTERRKETQSVEDFLFQFVNKSREGMEESFLKAVYDTRLKGFQEGMSAALNLLNLFSEIGWKE